MGLHFRLMLCAICAVIVLTGCNSTPVKPVVKSEEQLQQEAQDQVKDLLERANTAEANQKLELLLDAAEILVQLGDTPWARSIINNLPVNANSEAPNYLKLQVKKRLIQSYIAAADGYYPLAYDRLNSDFIDDALPAMPANLAKDVYRLRAQLLFDMEFYAASTEQRVLLSNLQTSGDQASRENEALIWQTLMEIPLDELQRHVETAQDRELKGWYQLATLSKNNQTNLRQQLHQLDAWVAEWPDHPASLSLPADLQLLRQLLEEQPTRIAFLLPLTGKLGGAGNAIRDGFLAAYFERQQIEPQMPELRFYDTDNADINTLYDQAITDGNQLVIGPLSKDSILELSLRPSMPVPTLALNAIDNPLSSIENLYQFSLGVEDEARIAATKAFRDGHRRALIIAPNSPWGDRSVDAFIEQWRLLGGELTSDYRFEDTNDYVKVIQSALKLDESYQRAREVRSVVGHIEFEPRRRQDIDMIFLAAQAQQARQVKPTLAFHYAGDIPVYGTSQVYSGEENRKLDQDMNGMKFSTIPWIFNNQLPEKIAIQKYTDNYANFQPLYALGVDCFHLYPRLKQLEKVKQAHFYGQTGKLNLNENRQFVRQQVWAEFRGGLAKPLQEPK